MTPDDYVVILRRMKDDHVEQLSRHARRSHSSEYVSAENRLRLNQRIGALDAAIVALIMLDKTGIDAIAVLAKHQDIG